MSPALALDSGPDDLLELAQATPPTPPPAAGGPERRDRPAVNPKAFCLDQIARRAGNRTYLKVRLDLKAEQMTAWNAFAKASDDADVKDTARCNALPDRDEGAGRSYVDRLTLEENAMKARVERIEAVKPTPARLLQHAVAGAEGRARPAASDGRHGPRPASRRPALRPRSSHTSASSPPRSGGEEGADCEAMGR